MREFIIRAENNKFTPAGEIVHCKGCKWRGQHLCMNKDAPAYYMEVEADDYCSYGEYKDEREVSMSGDVMPKEQHDFIKGIQDYMLEASNMKEDEAWDFGFRIWQFQDWLKGYIEKVQLSPETSTNDEEMIIKTGQTYGKSANLSKDIVSEQIKKHAERIKVEPKPACEDAISRADTIKAMCSECEVFPGDDMNCADCTEVAIVRSMPPVTPTDKVVDFNNMISAGGRIRNLPPVTPTERPKGEWARHELWGTPWYTCSECNFHGRNDYKFCPNCGADMRGAK